MAKRSFISNLVTLPASKLYGAGVWVRNIMFKWGILRQRRFNVPVVVVGNLAVGGTGKTPHVEYILDLLKFKYRIGMISRGYKRKTKGFVLATRRSSPLDIGDEPYQIYQKFGRDVTVAVCEDRVRGIEELLRIDPKINLIVLDDAYQHRYVKPTVSILLTDFNAPVFDDTLLPHGRLREPMNAIYRADMVVVTKCPERLKAIEYRIFKNSLKLFPYQGLFFSSIEYEQLTPLFPDKALQPPYLSWLSEHDSILAVSGIANPRPFVRYLRSFHAKVKIKQFPDHYNFTRRDLELLLRRFNEMDGERKLLITTEKDAVRMLNNPYFPEQLKECTYYLPVKVRFDPHNVETFDDELQKLLLKAVF